MSHSPLYIEALIREGASLKKKISIIAQDLEYKEHCSMESGDHQPYTHKPVASNADHLIRFITPVAGVLENVISDIFSLICRFDGIDHGGIYFFNRIEKRLDLVCHYNLPDEFVSRSIQFARDSWQVNTVLEGTSGFIDVRHIPKHIKIGYEKFGISAIAIIPLVHHGQLVGCMKLASSKQQRISGLEKLVIDELALRISRAIALHVAQVRLRDADNELAAIMVNLQSGLRPEMRPWEPGSLNDFYFGMMDEVNKLFVSISSATERIKQNLTDELAKRELPYQQKKVDKLLQDIEFILNVILRLRVFCKSQPAVVLQGMRGHKHRTDGKLQDAMADFYEAVKVLISDAHKPKHSNNKFTAENFRPLNMPVRLGNIHFRINRLTTN